MGAILIRKNGFAFTALVSVLLASCALVRDLQSTDLDPAETLPIATHTEAVESETPEEAPLQTMTPTVTVQLEPFTFSLDGPARDSNSINPRKGRYSFGTDEGSWDRWSLTLKLPATNSIYSD